MGLPESMVSKEGVEVSTITGKLQVFADYYGELYELLP